MIQKETLEEYLRKGISIRKIANIENVSKSTISYYIKKYNLISLQKYKKSNLSIEDKKYFNKIDTKEKAYIAGWLLGDGYINKNNDIELTLALIDDVIISNIADLLPWNVTIERDNTFDKKARRFPRIRLRFNNRSAGKDLVKHFGGRLSNDKHVPRLARHLEVYLLAGFFDADGSVTWGYRKDRNRLWHKVSFTASLSILTGVQKILLKYNISTIIRPKGKEKVYIIEFASRKDILKFYEILPTDVIRLQRKISKFNALIRAIELNPPASRIG